MGIKMGIPKLNKLLVDQCSQKSIHKIHLETLFKKKIAVDISIYLYRFLGDDNFMEHVYLFLSLFKYYCIEPIFVFDGKPPIEKTATIQKRNIEKQTAKQEYIELESLLAEATKPYEKRHIEKRMESLKKKMIRVKWEHIDNAIELIQAFGFSYYLAPNEADQLCVHLSKKGDVYAIMSDDMDMIISGCSRVIRNLNMSTHEVVMYNNEGILHDLNISLLHFRQIIILSGTDYHTDKSHNISIKRAFELYQEYISTDQSISLYEWLLPQDIIPENFMDIYNLFESDNYANILNTFLEAAPLSSKKMSVSTIKSIMSPYRFIFL